MLPNCVNMEETEFVLINKHVCLLDTWEYISASSLSLCFNFYGVCCLPFLLKAGFQRLGQGDAKANFQNGSAGLGS